MLTFTNKNKKAFKVDDQVKLEVNTKNIKSGVNMKIFSIDLEKQYLENGGEIDEQINLKFLVAMEERKEDFVFKDPFEEKKVELAVPELDGRLGMFIVELEAEGITSRAVIRKGTIILKNNIIPVGH